MGGYHLKFNEHGARQWGRPQRHGSLHRITIEGRECAYCGAEIPLGNVRLMTRLSFGFGQANKREVFFCSRVHRGLFFERGPKYEPDDKSPGRNRQLGDFAETEAESEPARSPGTGQAPDESTA